MSEQRLHQRLMMVRADIARDFPRHDKAYSAMIEHLYASGVGAGALREGDILPEFALPNAEGRLVRSTDLLKSGPIVLCFYRGEWCPYCQCELDVFAEHDAAIRAEGAQTVLISAETGGQTLRSKNARAAQFEILTDADLGVAMGIGLVFMITPEVRAAYTAVNRNFSAIYGNDSGLLPIPATYIVGKNGRICSAFIDPDFTNRADPVDIIAKLRMLKD